MIRVPISDQAKVWTMAVPGGQQGNAAEPHKRGCLKSRAGVLAEKVILLDPRDTKTNEAREIPLDDDLVEMLPRLPGFSTAPISSPAFGDSKTGFNAACRRVKIENFRFHDLRHCAATNLRKAGVPQNVILSISGHKTDAMLRRYDKVDREDRQAALLEQVQRLQGRPAVDLQQTA